METKKCPRCGKELPLSDFYLSRTTGKPYPYFKDCNRQMKKESDGKKRTNRTGHRTASLGGNICP